MKKHALAILCGALAATGAVSEPVVEPASDSGPAVAAPASEAPAGMVWIPPGTFDMGSDAEGAWANERPGHRVRVSGFWIDETEVTNDQYAAFVEATGYVTVAERPVDWEELKTQLPPGTPKPPPEMLQPGSLVFRPTREAVPLNQPGRWWHWTDGASWRHPEGPDSNLKGRGSHPVVQVAWDDAMAYAAWAGKQLPTEVQWERAARGETLTRYTWGDELKTDAVNTWTGHFPDRNTEADGFFRTAPVKTYPPNDFGAYEMTGNVWEWCRDLYRDDRNVQLAALDRPLDPSLPETGLDAVNPGTPTRVVKGGSYLCHVDYCESYRPSARRGTTHDTGLGHTGFRCVVEPGDSPGAGEKVKSQK